MAVVRMQKLGICAMTSHRGDILGTLQSMGVMQMEQGFDAQGMACPDTHDAAVQFNRYAAQLDSAVRVLSLHAPEESRGFSLFEGRQGVTREEFDRSKAEADELLDAGRDIVDLSHDIREAQDAIGRDEVAQAALRPWMGLDVPFDCKGTRDTAFVAGTFQGDVMAEELVQELTDGLGDDAPVEVCVLTREAGLTYASVLYLREVSEKVEENLRRLGFARPSSSLDGTPAELMAAHAADIERQRKRIEEARRRIDSYAPLRSRIETCADYFRDRAARYELLASVPGTRSVFFLEGWVTARQAPAIRRRLEERYGACVEFEEAREGEEEPTLLHNNHFSAAVEPVLESYGLPRHGKVDPSFIMSIFYVFFFGMMLSDAGYGILVALGCGVALARHRTMSEGTNRMLRLFFWCGISTTFWGALFGGFFGNAVDTIATTFLGYDGPQIVRPLWFEPIADPMTLLMWCLLFGIIHLFVGLGIKGYELLKDGDGLGFAGEVLSWYLLLVGLILMLLPTDLFASIAGFAVALPGWVATLSNACAALGAIMIILLGSRDSANWGVRIASGLYDLYGVTSWLSDLLSYSRLLALGLATGVIANVINMMAAMMGPSPLGIVAFVLIFVLGHTMNIGINMLGAYVHTNRLQFVEFFGKFYDGGGKAFRPFGTDHRYVEIREES